MQKHIHCSQENPSGKSQGFRLRDWVSYLSCQLGFLAALSSVKSQQCFPPYPEAWEMLKFGSRHFLKRMLRPEAELSGIYLQIKSPLLLTLGTQRRPWVGALVPAQPRWKVSTTGCYLWLNKSNFGKMHNEFSSGPLEMPYEGNASTSTVSQSHRNRNWVDLSWRRATQVCSGAGSWLDSSSECLGIPPSSSWTTSTTEKPLGIKAFKEWSPSDRHCEPLSWCLLAWPELLREVGKPWSFPKARVDTCWRWAEKSRWGYG